jgi:hypothetical protein
MYASNGHVLRGVDYDSDGDMVIHTPGTSDDTSSDEMMATPTSSTATIIAPDNSPIFSFSPPTNERNHENNNQPFPSFLRAPIPLREKMKMSLGIVVDEEDEWSPDEADVSVLAPKYYNEFGSWRSKWSSGDYDMGDTSQIMPKSYFDLVKEEQREIELALGQSLAAMPVCEYQPATREQHRIMSAYTEDMTTEQHVHTKEDDEFFSEVLDDTIESDEEEDEEMEEMEED